jgi:transposase IS66 family protein
VGGLWEHDLWDLASQRAHARHRATFGEPGRAVCGGAYRMSKRRVASFCLDVLGVPVALGAVCQVEQTVAAALGPAVQEARAYVPQQDVNVEETPWREQQRRVRLWVVVTRWVSVFCLRTSRGAKVLWELRGETYGGADE